MLRVINSVERNVFADPPVQIVCTANTSVQALPRLDANVNASPETFTQYAEVKERIIFNSGTTNLYFAIGQTCDNVKSYNGWIVPGQQLDCSDHAQAVYLYSPTNNGLAQITILRRNDLENKN
jgi:hypothetical protein